MPIQLNQWYPAPCTQKDPLQCDRSSQGHYQVDDQILHEHPVSVRVTQVADRVLKLEAVRQSIRFFYRMHECFQGAPEIRDPNLVIRLYHSKKVDFMERPPLSDQQIEKICHTTGWRLSYIPESCIVRKSFQIKTTSSPVFQAYQEGSPEKLLQAVQTELDKIYPKPDPRKELGIPEDVPFHETIINEKIRY